MAEKFQYYKGLKFTRDEKTGYYLNSTHRLRMHRWVWLCERGEIPEGYQIHHIDGDKSNNDISNLELITISEHMKLHGELLTDEQRQWRRDNINTNARPKAIEWHKSEEGRKWHSEMVKKAVADGKLGGKRYKLVCQQCGKEFMGGKPSGKWCSGACQQKFRRQNHQNDAEFVCQICGKTFIADKYSKPTCCSSHCRNILRWQTLNAQKGN